MTKSVLLVGSVDAGKTTLRQRLLGQEQEYVKTQSVEVFEGLVDTPGEYLQHGNKRGALQVLGYDAEQILLLLDATAEESRIPPGFATSFNRRVVGVVTKADLANQEQIRAASERLELAGAQDVVCVSAVTGDGIDELKEVLCRQ